jgi:hypothetical protein
MSFTPESVFAMLTTRAEEATLRRLGTPPIDVAVLAKIDNAAPADLTGNMAQYGRRVVISDLEIAQAGWPGPPKRNDQILTQGKTLTIVANDPVILGRQYVMHRIITKGE